MRTSLVLFGIVIFINTFILHQAHSSATPSLPLLAWSPLPSSFPSKEILNSITPEIFESSLRALLRGGPSSILFSASMREVAVVFVEPQLRTDQVTQISNSEQFKNIKSAVLSSSSTLFAPYGTLDNQQSFVADTFSHLSQDPNVIFVNEEEDSTTSQHGLITIQLSELENYLSKHDSIFSDGIFDLIVVSFANTEGISTHDELVGSVLASLNSHTQNYVAIYTANTPKNIKLSFPEIKEDALRQGSAISHTKSVYSNLFEAANQTNCTNPTEVIQRNFFNGPMLEAYLVSIILISIITTGLCCMCELQTPQGFENGKANKFRQL